MNGNDFLPGQERSICQLALGEAEVQTTCSNLLAQALGNENVVHVPYS